MVPAESEGTKMAGCQGTSDDLGISSSRWRKAQARRQADYGRTVDLAGSESWEHCSAPDWKGKEKERAIDADQSNVN